MCPHYRVGLFEELHKNLNINFYFFSDRSEWYWEKRNPEIFGTFNYKQLRVFTLFKKIKIVPGLVKIVLWGNFNIYVKCINGKFALLFTFLGAKLRKKPFILWTGIWMHPQILIHKITFPIVKFIYHNSEAIVVYGEHVKQYLLQLGVDPKKIFIGWNSVDNSMYAKQSKPTEISEIRNKLNIGSQKIILYVGRLEKSKGLDFLLHSMAIVSATTKAILLIIGAGAEKSSLKELTTKLKLENIIFIDYIENDSLYLYYSIADIFVIPSVTTKRGKETWGLVVNEAMNQGCPVVATDVVGAAVGGLLQNGVNGLVVPEKNSKALAEAIIKILSDSKLYDDMHKAALQKIVDWNYNLQSQGFKDAINYVASQN